MKIINTKTLAGLVIAMSFASASQAGTITFDDLIGSEPTIAKGYGGLKWSNFNGLNSKTYGVPQSGYQNGTVSGEYIAYNGGGAAATFSSSTSFTLDDAYFTAAWRNGLNVHAVGTDWINTYIKDFTVDSTGPTDVFFDWNNIKSVTFSTSGGTPAFSSGYQFAMDNLTINEPFAEAVPEPETYALLLAGLGVLGFVARRRKSA